MRLGDVSPGAVAGALRHNGISIRTGPFIVRLRTPLTELAAPIRALYSDFPVVDDPLRDFHLDIGYANGFLSRLRHLIEARLDGEQFMGPAGRRLALGLLEWGLNACIYRTAHQYLVVHAACIAREDRAIVFPGESGTGKSTLCAALACTGWRLLSDELAIIRPVDGALLPIARPISLKNDAIDIIRTRFPNWIFGPRISMTAKGEISHLRPPAGSVAEMDGPASPKAVVFIKYRPDTAAKLEPSPKARAFFTLAESSINYHVRGADGFRELANLIDRSDCWTLHYDTFDDAIPLLESVL